MREVGSSMHEEEAAEKAVFLVLGEGLWFPRQRGMWPLLRLWRPYNELGRQAARQRIALLRETVTVTHHCMVRQPWGR